MNAVCGLLLLVLWLATSVGNGADDLGQAYVKKATWAETMIETRANCAEWARTAKEGQLASTPLRSVWAKIAKDWPVQSAWFTRDLPRQRHLDWFLHARDTSFEQWLLGLVLPKLGAMRTELQGELDELKRAKVPPSDSRWLDLYGRACRVEEVLAVSKGVWLVELKEAVEGHVARLIRARTPSEDAAWARLKELAAKCAEPGVVAHASRLADLRPLAACALREKLNEAEPRWGEIIAGAMKGDARFLSQIPILQREVREFRRTLLRSLPGMTEFLDEWAGVGLEQEWESQFAVLLRDLGNRAGFEKIAGETFRADSRILPGDRDPADVVIRRVAALLADLRLDRFLGELAELQRENAATPLTNREARYLLYARACRLRREIAFRNPLLAFDKLLFLKRHLSIYNHMCDQYYGVTAHPGGGLYVLENPFAPNARVRDLLANSVVERGRLKGQKLSGGPNRAYKLHFDAHGNVSGEEAEGGAFLAPDVSFDGREIAFAYVECRGDGRHIEHTDPSRGHWVEGRCYHIFRVNADGSGLQQLTDGTWNDFDPCWMPSGRIAFISERRGGYLRCGRICPTYTLHDMAPDGSDIRCLSPHETNEWHPSVKHDGMIVWTRWDYVDRHGVVAHMPWTTTPDGRDPRPVHGNYSFRTKRPDMELDVRAIPGSPKFVATAAPHHGQSFGSLILIDPRVPDNDAMGPVKRLTPEIAFPETQGGTVSYGEAWPLSEDYYLCVYDPEAAEQRSGGPVGRGIYGIYLLDSFGNKELIYRDPEIGCHNPMPLAARPRPPVVPDASVQVAAGEAAEGTMAVMDVYRSFKPWPPGTRIKALRIYQILPQSLGSTALPHTTGIPIPFTISVNVARKILGTVPVESDGSAYFVVPARKELFFQALDENGLAIQSMRSATHVQPGEKAVCQGCHEPKQRTPPPSRDIPLALQRAPSRIQPDVDGTNPFSYPRLVQPVLDKNCVPCHRQRPDKTPRLDSEWVQIKRNNWQTDGIFYASYLSLAEKYGFYDYGGRGWEDERTYRTIPGQFGARASKLYSMLVSGHHDVKLSPEELHRIAVWLDSTSPFYGVYEREGGLIQLRGGIAQPTLE